ncbi:Alpha amylase catalytic region [Planctomycetales bacterium 10988]|nr:Alpha amylase catalytic region [Planctomycetales bacterium 10988]
MEPAIAQRMQTRLQTIYGERGAEIYPDIEKLIESYKDRIQASPAGWDQRDVVLITYGDQVRQPEEAPLATLGRFLREYDLDSIINTVHLLPCFPYSSDDGFSVIDFRQIDPDLGTWEDTEKLSEQVHLMYDLVLNHSSQECLWFQGFLKGEAGFQKFYIEMDPSVDLSQVTRPRSLPLLTKFETQDRGEVHVWTTFSADQVDLNYEDPGVLLEMLDVLLLYIAEGARIVRMDAIAYLWKEVGTTCIHHPKTHEMVKLFRDLVDAVAPQVLLLTETNVPHRENVSYFGDGDEAHMVYQFSLPPLLLDAFLSEDPQYLIKWLSGLSPPGEGMTYFNFTASHDGVGVRPLEGLVPDERFKTLVEAVRDRGGKINTKRNPDGTDSPYEMNITYVDALGGTEENPMSSDLHARRFLASQGLMLGLQGIPGIYFHSLVGTPNDYAGVEASGINRRINRHKFNYDELKDQVDAEQTSSGLIFAGYQNLLKIRQSQPAFDPSASQSIWEDLPAGLIGVLRRATDEKHFILVLINATSKTKGVRIGEHTALPFSRDLLTDTPIDPDQRFELEPFQVAWIEAIQE